MPEQRKEVDVTILSVPAKRLTRERMTVQRDELNDRCITEFAFQLALDGARKLAGLDEDTA
jgi:hypothetical protein